MQQRLSDLVEHELVERVGADVAFGAAVFLAAGADRVVVAAVVVAVPGAVAATHLVAVGADAADTALDQALQQPLSGFGPARAPLGVVDRDPSGGLEHVVGDDAGAVDRDPVGAVTWHLTGAAGRPPVGHRLGAVEVDPPDIGLVPQQPGQRGVRPGRLPGRRRHPVGVEAAADLADGRAGGPVGEDAPHHDRFGFVDLQVRRPGRRAAGDPTVAVGGLPGGDLAGAGAEQLAAPVPFGDLGLLVLSDHALHLGEQGGLRVAGGEVGGVGEMHRRHRSGPARRGRGPGRRRPGPTGPATGTRRRRTSPPRRRRAARPGRAGPAAHRSARHRRTR